LIKEKKAKDMTFIEVAEDIECWAMNLAMSTSVMIGLFIQLGK
jgi:hypothetical protein